MHFLLGLIIIGVGVLILRYIRQTYEFVGSWDWAERFFGIGGTINALKLTGILMITVGTLYALGWI